MKTFEESRPVIPSQIEGFLNQIVVMLPAFRAVEERVDRETGRRFSLFDLFRTDEPATNRLLDFLLNPKGTHGQGDLFLRLFISRFVPEWRDAFASGRAQPATTNELIDVVISDNNHWLGIENKIFDAPEQKGQTDRYHDELSRIGGQGQGGDYYRLIYLSSKGVAPTEYSFTHVCKARHQGKFKLVAWVRPDEAREAVAEDGRGSDVASLACVLDWLAECENQCRADNVRWLIRQFEALIRDRLVREEEKPMTGNAIIDLALRSADTLDAALRIGEASSRIREKISRALLSNVQRRLQEWVIQSPEGWEVISEWPGGNWITTPSEKCLPILLRRKTWPGLLGAALTTERRGPSEVAVGVLAPTRAKWDGDPNCKKLYGSPTRFIDGNVRQEILAALKLAAPDGDFWVNFITLRDLSGRCMSDWTKIETITRVHLESDELAKQIVDKIVNLARTVNDIVK